MTYKYYLRNKVKVLAGPFDTPQEARDWIPNNMTLEIVKVEIQNTKLREIHYQTVKK